MTEASTLTTPKSPPAPSAPQLVLHGGALKTSLLSWSPHVLKETSGQAQDLQTLWDSRQQQFTTPRTWRTWFAAARMSAPLTTTQTRRSKRRWCAGEVSPRTLTLRGDGTSPPPTDAICSVTKVHMAHWTPWNPRFAELVLSVFCDGTRWVGEPEKGIWCFTSPQNPGPREDSVQDQDPTVPGF